ncbi:fluoride efflux transporter CrcB [Opitutaceae bacterium TAV4]|nr:fluoride efflux transporter CrcB [Opitutaceae bacterium TAV4]RRJ98830.1 fluoride efflux transporter CrcB [Opitutaceae bacterium TAV3]
MILYLLIALGSGLGGMARFALTGLVNQSTGGGAFPWGTIAVNVIGSFVIGFFATLTAPDGRTPVGVNGRQFFMTGVLGGFTTFSSFSLQTLTLAQEGELLRAGGNVLGSVALCLVAVWLGHLTALALNPAKS